MQTVCTYHSLLCVDAHFLACYCLNKVALQWVNRRCADSDCWCLCFSILSLTWGVGPFCSLIWKSEYCCSSSGCMAAFNLSASARSTLSCGQGTKWVKEPWRVCFGGRSLWQTFILNVKHSGRRTERKSSCFTPRGGCWTSRAEMHLWPYWMCNDWGLACRCVFLWHSKA